MPARQHNSPNLTLERGIALLSCLNFILVIFDLTYVPWRNFWLQGRIPIPLTRQSLTIPMPQVDCADPTQVHLNSAKKVYYSTSVITCFYDPIKGIEPHIDTRNYLAQVNTVTESIQVNGLKSPVTATALKELRAASQEMVTNNPFAGVGKSGTLEKIKNQMRQRVFGRSRGTSSKQAFERFWSTEYLGTQNWQQELNWFNQQVSPLIATNYYRSIDESGEPTNNFGWLDTPFALTFGLVFLLRAFYLRRRFPKLSWADVVIWRWYDLLLIFPFWWFLPSWAWLRGIAVLIHLDQAQWLKLERVRETLSKSVVANITDDMTTAVVVQILNQAQGSIRRGDFTRWLARPRQSNPIIANDIDEIAEIITLLGRVTIQNVLPRVRPELQILLQHNIEQIFSRAPAYANLKALPGLSNLSQQLSERLAAEATQGLFSTVKTAAQDKVAIELTRQLVSNFVASLGSEVQQQKVIAELQTLVADMLEELKLNYQGQTQIAMMASQTLPPAD
jgi:hypothetical protein